MVTILDTIYLVGFKNWKKPNLVYDKLEHHDASALIKHNSILELMSDRHGWARKLGLFLVNKINISLARFNGFHYEKGDLGYYK